MTGIKFRDGKRKERNRVKCGQQTYERVPRYLLRTENRCSKDNGKDRYFTLSYRETKY